MPTIPQQIKNKLSKSLNEGTKDLSIRRAALEGEKAQTESEIEALLADSQDQQRGNYLQVELAVRQERLRIIDSELAELDVSSSKLADTSDKLKRGLLNIQSLQKLGNTFKKLKAIGSTIRNIAAGVRTVLAIQGAIPVLAVIAIVVVVIAIFSSLVYKIKLDPIKSVSVATACANVEGSEGVFNSPCYNTLQTEFRDLVQSEEGCGYANDCEE